jgi:hypothetical protein
MAGEDLPQPSLPQEKYLGDGVYASFDGFNIWLAANDHTNKVVALEPSVLEAVMRYARNVNRHYDKEYFRGVGK